MFYIALDTFVSEVMAIEHQENCTNPYEVPYIHTYKCIPAKRENCIRMVFLRLLI